MTNKKQQKTKATYGRASIIIETVTVVPIIFACISWFSLMLISTSALEHQCDRLEANYVKCQPRAILIDRILNQTRPSYKIDRIFFKQAKPSLREFTANSDLRDREIRWKNDSQYHVYVTTSDREILELQRYSSPSLFVVEEQVESLNDFVIGIENNSRLIFYTDLPRKYLFIYGLVIAFLWLVFMSYLYQTMRRILLAFGSG